MKKIIEFLESIEDLTFKKIRQTLQKIKFGNQIFAILVLLFLYFSIIKIYNWGCENLQELCDSNSEAWYCVCNDPTIAEQLTKLENSQLAAPWKVTLDHKQTGNQVKIVSQIKLTDKAYLSLFQINVSSDTMIINVNNYPIDALSNKNIDLTWSVNLIAGKNFFKVIITPHPIEWTTILSNKKVALIDSLKISAKFWTTDSF